jgi:SAM-dependent methyltransferase
MTTATNTTPQPDLVAVKRRQQQTWASGDYAAVAARIVVMAERLAVAADLQAGERVLDVATGTGNAALAAARCGCQVTGVDYVPELLERGRTRAAAEGLQVEFVEGDAEQLAFPDGSFDTILSCLGVMFTPDQERAAAELLRVCRPGGTIALANWTPSSFIGELFRTVARHVPPPGSGRRYCGDGGAPRRALRGGGLAAADRAARVRVPIPLPGRLRAVLPGQLRPGPQGLRGPE